MVQHQKVMTLMARLSRELQQFGIRGPASIRLSTEDGEMLEKMVGTAGNIYTRRGSTELTHNFEYSGVRFEWPVAVNRMDDEERKNLGL